FLAQPLTATEAMYKGMISGGMGAIVPMAVSGLWDPAVFEGSPEEILNRFGQGAFAGVIQGGADGVNAFIDEPYQKALQAADKDAKENPNSTKEAQAAAAKSAFEEEVKARAEKLEARSGSGSGGGAGAGAKEEPAATAKGSTTPAEEPEVKAAPAAASPEAVA